jgi:hypothetical protein
VVHGKSVRAGGVSGLHQGLSGGADSPEAKLTHQIKNMKSSVNRLVVGDASWAESIPQWLLDEIRSERLMLGMCGVMKERKPSEMVGDAEVVAYLMTASLRAPLSSEMVNIYVYLTAQLMARGTKEVSPDFQETVSRGLTEWEQKLLDDLRWDIYDKRGGEIRSPLLDMLKTLKKAA